MIGRVRRLVITAAIALGTGLVPLLPARASTPKPVPTARIVTSVWATGALFAHRVGTPPDVHNRHFCSASVIRSPARDLIITAAHCIHGRHQVYDFAPEFHDGRTPHGIWGIDAVFLPYAWKHSRSPLADFAILRVERHQGRGVQRTVGGRGLATPDYARSARVAGYPAGTDGRPITCTNRIYRTRGYPSFDCRGYVGGVSGGPFLQGGAVVGVVGGLRSGGCVSSTSYSSPFGFRVTNLLGRAEAGGPGDVWPTVGRPSGC